MAKSTPKFTFRMTFRGLCLFVPEDKGETKFSVLLPNARPDNKYQPCLQECATHFPLLLFSLKNVCTSSLDPVVADSQGFIVLREIDVDIDPPPPVVLGMKNRMKGVPNIDEVFVEAGGVDKSIVDDPGKDHLVTARFKFDRGTLKTPKSFKFNGVDVMAEFSPKTKLPKGGKHFRGPMASAVDLVIENIRADSVTLRLKRFGVPGESRIRLFPVKTRTGWDVLSVTVANVCGESIVPLDNTHIEPPERDSDFSWHYMLTKNRSKLVEMEQGKAKKPVPLPVPIDYAMRPVGGNGGGIPVRCGTARSKPPVVSSVPKGGRHG